MHAEPATALAATAAARPAVPIPHLTLGMLARYVAAGGFLGHAVLIAREAVTWVADEPTGERLLAGLEAAAPALLAAAALLSWHLIPRRWPVPVGAALLAIWPAYYGFTRFIEGAAIPDGSPLQAVAMAQLSAAALILVARAGQPSLNWAAMTLALTGLVFALVATNQWRAPCGLESTYGGCAVAGRLEEERLLAGIELPAGTRWVEVGRAEAAAEGAPGGLLAVPSGSARVGAFRVPSAFPHVGAGAGVESVEAEQGRAVLGLWAGPSPRDGEAVCSALLSRVDDPAKSSQPISLRAKAHIDDPDSALLRLVTWCE